MAELSEHEDEPTPVVAVDDAPRRSGRLEPLVLSVVAGPDRGATLDLDGRVRTVGKSADCDLVLTDANVSRRHLELRPQEWGVVVRDLGSTNGSFYHGARFAEVVVRAGAVVTIGDTQLVLSRRQAAAELAEGFGGMLGRSTEMRELFTVLARVAATHSTVLIEGETGTGKELCARAIHAASPRATGPFTVCDVAGISRTLIESELFGHVRGAFTGAQADRDGAFELADGGTLFLDEIGELDLDLQPRLLRAIEERTVRKVGSSRYRTIDVRVVAATNRDLAQEVAAGRFRQDLFHRLAVVRLRIPPLRDRKEDLDLLLRHFLARSGVRLSPAAMALLEQHDWPGNIRELRNVIERGIALAGPAGVIDPETLGLDGRAAPPAEVESVDRDTYHEQKRRIIEAWERSFVEQALAGAGGNVSEAARRCGLGRAYLHRLIRKYGLD